MNSLNLLQKRLDMLPLGIEIFLRLSIYLSIIFVFKLIFIGLPGIFEVTGITSSYDRLLNIAILVVSFINLLINRYIIKYGWIYGTILFIERIFFIRVICIIIIIIFNFFGAETQALTAILLYLLFYNIISMYLRPFFSKYNIVLSKYDYMFNHYYPRFVNGYINGTTVIPKFPLNIRFYQALMFLFMTIIVSLKVYIIFGVNCYEIHGEWLYLISHQDQYELLMFDSFTTIQSFAYIFFSYYITLHQIFWHSNLCSLFIFFIQFRIFLEIIKTLKKYLTNSKEYITHVIIIIIIGLLFYINIIEIWTVIIIINYIFF